MNTITETIRLQLREFRISDAHDLYALNADPEVLRYTGDKAFGSPAEAESFLTNYRDYDLHGFGRWAVIDRESGDFLGWCGLKRNEENLVDLGFRLFKSAWGQGYATEAAKACLGYGFESLKLEEIIGRASRENSASLRVLQKLGMDFWKYGSCEGIPNAVYWRISKERFRHLLEKPSPG